MSGVPFLPAWHTLATLFATSPSTSANVSALELHLDDHAFSYHTATLAANGGGDSDIQRAMDSLIPALWQSFAVILLGYACVKLEVVKQSHKQVSARHGCQ